jgi:hypothetical protein
MVNDIMLGKNWENVESQKKENVSFGQEIEQHLTLDTRECIFELAVFHVLTRCP